MRLCRWSWPRAFLSLASRGSVLGKAVLGLGFFVSLASSIVSSTPPLINKLLVPRQNLFLPPQSRYLGAGPALRKEDLTSMKIINIQQLRKRKHKIRTQTLQFKNKGNAKLNSKTTGYVQRRAVTSYFLVNVT